MRWIRKSGEAICLPRIFTNSYQNEIEWLSELLNRLETQLRNQVIRKLISAQELA